MKQKDIGLFVAVALFSGIFSVIISNLLITPNKIKKQQAEKVAPISADFSVPTSDSKYFNKDSINPTKLIQIGDGSNASPFNGTTR